MARRDRPCRDSKVQNVADQAGGPRLAAAEEAKIIDAGAGKESRDLFRDVLDRYAREVSPKKRGKRWEEIRLAKIGRGSIGAKRVCDLEPKDFAAWRDERLAEVSAGSVIREMQLMSSVLAVAAQEWGLVRVSPIRGVRKPLKPKPRDRRPSADELERMAKQAGDDPTKVKGRCWLAFLFAIETGMRAGEIVGLRAEDVSGKVAHLELTKNGTSRDVPLSTEARRILSVLPPSERLFGLSSAQLDANFRQIKAKAKVKGLTFHDSRHEAVTRLSKILVPLELAKMIGHSDLNMLMVYYEAEPESVADRLG